MSARRGRPTQMHVRATRARAPLPLLLFLHADTALCLQDFETFAQAGANKEQLWGRFDVQFVDAT